MARGSNVALPQRPLHGLPQPGRNFVLGLSELQMNRDHDYGGRKANRLEVLERRGLLRVNWLEDMKVEIRRELSDEGLKGAQRDEKAEEMVAAKGQRQPVASSLLSYPPEKLRRLVDPSDSHRFELASPLVSARQLHQCHVEAGGGNSQFDVNFLTDADRMKLIDVAPLHDTFGVPDAKLVASGSPEHSLLLHRIAVRGGGQMPPLATAKVDEAAVKLLREWIQTLKPMTADAPLTPLTAYPRTGRGEGDRHILLPGHRKMSQSPPVLG